jgi:hypothetical protein
MLRTTGIAGPCTVWRYDHNGTSREENGGNMKRCINLLVLLGLAFAPSAFAGAILHIADGDCSALSAAAAAAPGQEPAMILLAPRGSYAGCAMKVTGNIVVDGAGAQLLLVENSHYNYAGSEITIAAGAQLTLRNLNLGGSAGAAAAKGAAPKFLTPLDPAITNSGVLVLDSSTLASESFGMNVLERIGGGLINNTGSLVLRNATVTNTSNGFYALFIGNVEIVNSTIATKQTRDALFGAGTYTIANSIVMNSGGPICSGSAQVVSQGGNVVGDASCTFSASGDRFAADARFGDFALHGGVVGNLALNYDSPALGNGLASNCEASDARGFARGTTRCDAGAYEFGGGIGRLDASGMSGLYYNPTNGGHFVTIQRLGGADALVIWNTFDQNGVPAWLYGVGTVSGNSIHVAQVARNVGGKLLPGGDVTGAHAVSWGTLDVGVTDCTTASLSYSSADAAFGTGSTSLQRLAFLGGVECQR